MYGHNLCLSNNSSQGEVEQGGVEMASCFGLNISCVILAKLWGMYTHGPKNNLVKYPILHDGTKDAFDGFLVP